MPHTPSFLPIAENVHQRFQMPDECAHTSLMDWTSNTLPPETSHVFIRPLDNIDPRTKRENEFKLGRVVAEYQLAKLGHEIQPARSASTMTACLNGQLDTLAQFHTAINGCGFRFAIQDQLAPSESTPK